MFGRKRKKNKIEPRSKAQRMLLRYGWLLPVGGAIVGGAVLLFTYAFASIPLPRDIQLTSSAEVYDVHGNLIGTYTDEVTRFLIDTGDLMKKKPFIGQAVIASEDRNFYEHGGVSVKGIVRAAWANLTGGEVQQGGSTITQQYVKNAVLQDPSRTVTRKIKEAVLAIKMERRYSKKQILGFYLNTIYLGRGAYGIEAAARVYFDKSAPELNLNQAAYLAGIIPSPESYQPDLNPKGARARRDRVLGLMVEQGYISQARADKAMRRKVKLTAGAASTRNKTQKAAYFMEWLRKNFLFPEFKDCLYTCGLKIYTTLDLDMQDAAEQAVATTLDEPGDPQAALVSMTPRGEVRAMVGGKDFDNVKKARGFNYATTYPGRQPGSSFKPFTLLTAIEEGISPQSRLSGASPQRIDEPACYTDGGPWEVSNYGNSSFGTITLDQATTNSVNTVFAQLIAEVGVEKVVDTVDDFGFNPKYGTKEIAAECSLALGGSSLDVTPLEMARAYAGFAGTGQLPHVTPIRFITNNDGDCVTKYFPRKAKCENDEIDPPERAADENSVAVLTESLQHVVQGGTATAANIGRPVAGKTGTTQNNENAWFAGFVPQLATVVWMGYPIDDGVIPQMGFCADTNLCRPVHGISVTGGSFPAQIWAAFMSQAVADMEVLPFPVPTDEPDEILNPPPASPTATPSPKKKKESPEPEPTTQPSPDSSPSPSPEPSEPPIIPTGSPEPSPSGGGNDRRGGPP